MWLQLSAIVGVCLCLLAAGGTVGAEPLGPPLGMQDRRIVELQARFEALKGMSYMVHRMRRRLGEPTGRPRLGFDRAWQTLYVHANWPRYFTTDAAGNAVSVGETGVIRRSMGTGVPQWEFFERDLFATEPPPHPARFEELEAPNPLEAFAVFTMTGPTGARRVEMKNVCPLDDEGLRWSMDLQVYAGTVPSPQMVCRLAFSRLSGLLEQFEIEIPYRGSLEVIRIESVWVEAIKEHMPILIVQTGYSMGWDSDTRARHLYPMWETQQIFENWTTGLDDPPQAFGWGAFGRSLQELEGQPIQYFLPSNPQAGPGIVEGGKPRAVPPVIPPWYARAWQAIRRDPMRALSSRYAIGAMSGGLFVMLLISYFSGLRRERALGDVGGSDW